MMDNENLTNLYLMSDKGDQNGTIEIICCNYDSIIQIGQKFSHVKSAEL